MTLRAKLVMPLQNGTWVREFELSIAPFPGLGIRLDVYEIFNVDSVVVGDFGCAVTCIGVLEGLPDEVITEERCQRLGFEEGLYP
ncbi:MAG: hypothetical protein L0154_03420 [Chloroflexi bacterium]|nr:hypothetical protein [Chloroflexota bacterium]